jgi:hypothetical protein
MSHHHAQALKPAPTRTAPGLNKSDYGAIVGRVEGPLRDANGNHVFIPLRVISGPFAGPCQVAFNIESTDDSPDQYLVRDEAITMADVPTVGLTTDTALSYGAIGLKQADFQSVENGKLRMLVHDATNQVDLIAVYGMTYSDGGGIHDVHYNNGEPPGSRFRMDPNHDSPCLLVPDTIRPAATSLVL